MQPLTFSDKIRATQKTTSDFAFTALTVFTVFLGIAIFGSIFVDSSRWSRPDMLLVLNGSLLALAIRQVWLSRQSIEGLYSGRDTHFPVFSRAELMIAQKRHQQWSKLAEKQAYGGVFHSPTPSDLQILRTLDIELLKDFEIMGEELFKGKADWSPAVKRLLMHFHAEYWEEVTRQRVIRMLEANIAVANGAKCHEWSEDPLHDIRHTVPSAAKRLQQFRNQ